MDVTALEIIDGIRLKGSLKKHVIKNQLIDMISDRIKAAIPNLVTLAKDLELLKLVCNCVENAVKKHSKLDKKEVVNAIYKKLFPLLTEKDIEEMSSNIDMLHYNGMIQRIAYSTKVWAWLFGSGNKKKD